MPLLGLKAVIGLPGQLITNARADHERHHQNERQRRGDAKDGERAQ